MGGRGWQIESVSFHISAYVGSAGGKLQPSWKIFEVGNFDKMQHLQRFVFTASQAASQYLSVLTKAKTL